MTERIIESMQPLWHLIIPTINFIGIIVLIIHIQYLRRQIKEAWAVIEERRQIFADMVNELNRLNQKIELCPVLDEHNKKTGNQE